MSDIIIRPIQDAALYNQIVEQSRDDKREALLPTHVIRRNTGEIIGSLSFMPFAMLWTDSRTVKVRESQRILSMLESHTAMNGANGLCLPVSKDCPYFPFMEKTGYFNIAKVPFNLFVKGLK